jgi:hypothetical protein
MSTIVISNIKATGETASRAVSGVAAAWCNSNNQTATIAESFNCASFVDIATGQCQINLSSSMDSTTYSVTSAHFHDGGSTYETSMSIRDPLTTSSCSWVTYRCTATTFFDSSVVSFQACGDLA